jgi:para-nitrobenzyl esterase
MTKLERNLERRGDCDVVSGPTARIGHGNVQGRSLATGGALFAGIPYAQPPVRARRFLPPAPPTSWDGVRPCTTFGASCPQASNAGGVNAGFESTVEHCEDCLTLNVWTPSADDGRRPVVVWIHGGGFQSGGADAPVYAGHAFIESECVLVTVNYRLNVFGFLFLDDIFPTDAPRGNNGLLDQIAALEWVRENIAAFGGDPDNVTVAGQSAGAMSIGCLLTMPEANGLFERAILQSGACRHVISRDGATRVARRVLERVDVTETDWTTLQEVPAARLLDATRALTPSVVADLFEGPPFSPDTGATKVIDVTASIEDSRHAPLVSMWRAREPQPINHGNG